MTQILEDPRLKTVEPLDRMKAWDGEEIDHTRYGTLEIMASSGDVKRMWDKHSPDEVADARRSFDTLVREKKYAAFNVNKRGEQTGTMKEFDPNAEAYILVPPTRGG